MSLFERLFGMTSKPVRIGPSVVIDVSQIVAIYPKGQFELVIRFSGIGVMEIESRNLFESVECTVSLLIDHMPHCRSIEKWL